MASLDPTPFARSLAMSFPNFLTARRITLSSKIQLIDRAQQDGGRGVVAIEDIGDDEELFSIPRAAILSPSTSAVPDEIIAKVPDSWQALVITLLYEYAQGAIGLWWPYLAVLPTHFDSLMFWSDTELEMLRGSAVVNKIGKTKADDNFKAQVIPLVREYPNAFGAMVEVSDEELLSLCHRMGSTIMAYAFDIERADQDEQAADGEEWEEDDGQPLPVGMVPMADMLNADADCNNAKLYYEEDRVVMRSIKPIAAQSEIFNDYGAVPNADLARRYGYVTTNYCKYDVVEVSQALVKQVAADVLTLSPAEINNRFVYLQAEMSTDAFDIAHADAEDGQFPIELLGVLRCLALDRASFDKMAAKEKLPSDKALNADEIDVLQALQQIVIRRSKDYATNVILDDTTTRSKMARVIIDGEKQVVTEADATLRSLLQTSNKRQHGGSDSKIQQSKKVKR